MLWCLWCSGRRTGGSLCHGIAETAGHVEVGRAGFMAALFEAAHSEHAVFAAALV